MPFPRARPHLVTIDKEKSMTHKTLIAAVLAAGSLVGVAHAVPAVVANTGTYYPGTQVYGQPGQTVIVQQAPPAPLIEATPGARDGYVWTPGHYEWRDGRYVWMTGHWIDARPGYAWQPAHWQQRSDGSWLLVGGTWVQTNNYAYGRDDHRYDGARGNRDRDGDGVRNRDDRYPDNPYRN
jgi:hypothetical protein